MFCCMDLLISHGVWPQNDIESGNATVKNPLWVIVSPNKACIRVDFPLPTLKELANKFRDAGRMKLTVQ